MTRSLCLLALLALIISLIAPSRFEAEETKDGQEQVPTLYLIGDSTVRNGNGDGARNEWGWGDHLTPFFDARKIHIENHAKGGRSSRTFLSEGLWKVVFQKLRPGDFVFMQFGHNDATSLDSKDRPRGTIASMGGETREVLNQITGKIETVHTFNWYLRRYIADTRASGAKMLILSPVPRKSWGENGKLSRNGGNHAFLARQIAQNEKVWFVPLNDLVADEYDRLGQEKVSPFFPNDSTHTNLEGAQLNAAQVVAGLKMLPDSPFEGFLKAR